MSPAKNCALVTSLRRAFSIASRDGRLDQLDADHLARPAGEREPDRADAAVEVVDALVAAQAGVLDGQLVQPLGHLGVGLEERLGRDQEVEVADLVVQLRAAGEQHGLAALGGLAEPLGLRPEQPVAGHRVDQRVDVELAGRGDEADLELAAAAALAHDEVAQEAALVAPVPRAEALAAALGEHQLAQLVAALGRQLAVGHREDAVEAAGRVEAAHQLAAVAGPERVLELVAVAPLLERGHDRLLLEALEAPDPRQRVRDLLGLDLELALVREHLPRRARVVGDLRDAVRRGLEDLDRAGLGVGLLGLADDGAQAVAGHPARHEDDVAVTARDAVAAVGERIDGELELVAAAGAGEGGRGRHGHRG